MCEYDKNTEKHKNGTRSLIFAVSFLCFIISSWPCSNTLCHHVATNGSGNCCSWKVIKARTIRPFSPGSWLHMQCEVFKSTLCDWNSVLKPRRPQKEMWECLRNTFFWYKSCIQYVMLLSSTAGKHYTFNTQACLSNMKSVLARTIVAHLSKHLDAFSQWQTATFTFKLDAKY